MAVPSTKLSASASSQVGSKSSSSDSRRAKIIWVSCVGEKGGAEVYMLNLLRKLDRGEFDAEVAMLRPGPLKQDLSAIGINTIVLREHRMRNPIRVAGAILALSCRLRRSSACIVHSNGFRAHFYGGIAAKLANCQEVWTVHTFERPSLSTKAILAVPTNGVVANCQRTADFFISQNLPVSLIWPSVDPESLASQTGKHELAARYRIPENTRWITMGARLQEYKGHRFLIEAMAALPARLADAHAIIIGGALFGMEAGYLSHLRQLCRRYHVHDRVHFTGFVPNTDLNGFLKSSEFLVHPALDEDFGLIIAEAQFLRKPVLAFASAGPSAIISHRETGFLVEVGNTQMLVDGMVDLLDHPAMSRAWGQAGHLRVCERFLNDQAARQLARIYRSCLTASNRRRVA
jgi:glycosyltransferase involved in cell wall biosynthesis